MGIGLKRVARRHSDWLAGLDWRGFERLLAEHYRRAGYVVSECGTADGSRRFDGGVDLRLQRGRDEVLVQCRHWNVYKVPHNAVHELIGIVHTDRATSGILVTSGEFTEAARRAAAEAGHIELVDGAALRAMLGPLLPTAPLRAAVLPAFLRGAGHYRNVRTTWLRAQMAFFAFKLVFGMIVVGCLWLFIQHVLDDFSAKAMARAQKPATTAPSRLVTPPAAPATPYRATPKSEQERARRRELVRQSVMELNGVTSSAWLADGSLMLGMRHAPRQVQADAIRDTCDILGRYPEMWSVVEVQDTGARTHVEESVFRVGCFGTDPNARTR